MNALALCSSLFAISLQSAAAQEGGSPIRIHTSSSSGVDSNPYPSTGNWAVQPAISPMFGSANASYSSNGSSVRLSAHEDFSVPTANPPQILPKLDAQHVSATTVTQSSSPLFRTVSASKMLDNLDAQPVPSITSDVTATPPATGAPEIVLDGSYPAFEDGTIIQDSQFYGGGMPYAEQTRFRTPNNIGYDPVSMVGCAPENCRLYYANVEALYWKQEEDQSLSYSVGRNLSDFDYEWGGRVTIGEMFDCVNGWEFVYTGPFEWNRTLDLVGPGLNSTFRTVDPFLPAPQSLDTFFNASSHSQALRTKLSTYEVNRRWFASDLFSTLIGLRFVDYNERFTFASFAPNGDLGYFRNNTDNFLVGGQFGATMYRPVTQRLSYGAWGKIGVYANFAKNSTLLQNRGDTLADARRSDTSVAGLFQGGIGIRYQLLPRLVVTGGYEAMFVPGVATVANQQTFPLSLTSPNNVNQDDNVYFHGANAGVELSY
jgi:hypothetical protein